MNRFPNNPLLSTIQARDSKVTYHLPERRTRNLLSAQSSMPGLFTGPSQPNPRVVHMPFSASVHSLQGNDARGLRRQCDTPWPASSNLGSHCPSRATESATLLYVVQKSCMINLRCIRNKVETKSTDVREGRRRTTEGFPKIIRKPHQASLGRPS